MSDEMMRAFLHQMYAEPEQEVHRLALADWLEEHGQPERAEFLRLRLRLSEMGEDDPWEPALKREQELGAHLRQRLEALNALPVMWQFQLRPDGLVTANIKAEHLGWTETSSPEWAWVVELRVHGRVAITPILQALGSPHLARVVHLDLYNNGVGGSGVVKLTNWPGLARLTALGLNGNEIGPKEATALARSRQLGRLTRLDLGSNWIGDRGAKGVASSPRLDRLTHLSLGWNGISARGVEALASSAVFARLTHLDLSGNQIENAGARALASSPHLQRLTRLVVGNDRRMGQQGIAALRERFGSRVVV